jgi:hypothetical protein
MDELKGGAGQDGDTQSRVGAEPHDSFVLLAWARALLQDRHIRSKPSQE